MKTIIKLSILSLVLSLATFFTSQAQQKQSYFERRGDKFFAQLQYAKATHPYKIALRMHGNPAVAAKIGHCYFYAAQYDSAYNYYRQLKKAYIDDTTVLYNYVTVLLTKGRYVEARKTLKDYLKVKKANPRIRTFLKSCDLANTIVDRSNVVNIENMPFNSADDDFSPHATDEGKVIFVSNNREATQSARLHHHDAKPFLDLFVVEKELTGGFGKPQLYSKMLNDSKHEGPFTFSEGKIYFTQNTEEKVKHNQFKRGLYHLKIFSATPSGDDWSAPEPFAYNNEAYSVGHPTISPSGKYMVFVSDDVKGRGGKDLYISTKNGDTWETPTLLSTVVNTPANEMFPYFSSDTTLVFSTDGLPGLGGLDLYTVNFNNGMVSNPRNMGRPFNSSRDDFGYCLIKGTADGYFSSNRLGGKGGDDIYFFKNVSLDIIVQVQDSLTKMPIEGASISIGCMFAPPAGANTDAEGQAMYHLMSPDKHCLTVSKEGYKSRQVQVDLHPGVRDTTILVRMLRGKDDDFAFLPKRKAVKISNIFYDFDRWDLRSLSVSVLDTIYNLMIDNPSFVMEIHSHTDSRGSFDYNIELSRKRAEEVITFLAEHGIEKERILHVYHGESRLAKPCPDGVNCPEEQHQANRRSEFKVYDQWTNLIGY